MNIYYDPFLQELVEGPAAGENAEIINGTTVSFIGGTTGAVYNAGPGLTLSGNTFSANMRTASGGLVLSGGTAMADAAAVSQLISGAAQVKLVDVAALRGALTAGQAVDVTSRPDGGPADYRGAFDWTGSTLGFSSFPKFASGLTYLLIADITATAEATVTPSGTWVTGGQSAVTLPAGTSVRVAMLFGTASTCLLTFSEGATVSVAHLREFEVTACTTDAVAYLGALSDPDAFASFYLVKQNQVQPWTYIIDMGASPAVTVASGLAYQLDASTGTHTLATDVCPAGYIGRDAWIRIFVGASGSVEVLSPLQLGGPLTPNAVNNCVVRYRDGEAVLTVQDTLAGYIVTLTGGTESGSLHYGLSTSGASPYITFAEQTDSAYIDLASAVTSGEKRVIGNGYTETILTGGVSCTAKTTFANLGMSGVSILGGTATLGDVQIQSGGTVSVVSGGLVIERAIGPGTVDLGGTNLSASGSSMFVSGCTFTGGSAVFGGAVHLMNSAFVTLENVMITGCTGNQGGGICGNGSGEVELMGCTITGCTAVYGGGIALRAPSATARLSNCVVSGNSTTNPVVRDIALMNPGTEVGINGGCTIGTVGIRTSGSGLISLAGSNRIDEITNGGSAFSVSVIISSGASVNLTSSITPGGGITVLTGGCTVNGNAIPAGTYTSIDSTGTPT